MKLYEVLVDWSNWGWPVLADHLWQATLFSLFALAAATSLRRAPARARYFVWLIALTKFALPSALIVSLVKQVGIDVPALTRSSLQSSQGTLAVSPFLSPVANSTTVLRATEPTASVAEPVAAMLTAAAPTTSHLYSVVTCLWLAGCLLLLASWLRRRHRLSAALRKGRELNDGREAEALRRVRGWLGVRQDIKLVVTPAISEPGVWRVWRPVVVLPEGVTEQLDDDEIEAVFMHELSHVQRWDNLVGNLQRGLCCLFWFHPFIWLIDRRLLAEREQACDDAVVRLGCASEIYANGITKVCRYCLGWEVAGLSKVAGSDLKKRIERIISESAGKSITALQLAIVGFTALAALSLTVASSSDDVRDIGTNVQSNSGQESAVDARFVVREVRDASASDARPPATTQPRRYSAAELAVAEAPHQPPHRELTEGIINAPADVSPPPPIEVRAGAEFIENPPAPLNARVSLPEASIPPPEEPHPVSADNIGAVMVRATDAGYGDLKRFIGRYEVDPTRAENFVLDISLEGGVLWLKPSHAPRRRLVRQSETDFSDVHSDYKLTFVVNESDRVVGLRLKSWGRNVIAHRLVLPRPSLSGNTTFRLRGYEGARVVAVAGTFNNWNQSQLLFARDGDEWVCRVNLPPGTYQYKFIVDGNWLTDPNNSRTVHDERGIENSLLRTE